MVSGHGTEIFASRNWAFPSPTEISQYRAHTGGQQKKKKHKDKKKRKHKKKKPKNKKGKKNRKKQQKHKNKSVPHQFIMHCSELSPVAIPCASLFKEGAKIPAQYEGMTLK